MIGLKARRTHALTIEPLTLPLGVKRLAPSLVIMIDGVGVGVVSQPLVMEK
jgi:hypothetical protein